MNLDFSNLESIKQAGFSGFKKMADLMADPTKITNSPGVYLVLYQGPKHPEFLAIGTGGHFKGKEPNVPLSELKENWVDGALVVYIGKAGGKGKSATLQSRLKQYLKFRLKQYLKFGQGYAIGHYGGRLIWQLKHSRDLVVCWKPLLNDDPRAVERGLIQEFIGQYGKMPIANLQG